MLRQFIISVQMVMFGSRICSLDTRRSFSFTLAEMKTITQHPIVIWVCIIGGFMAVIAACVSGSLFMKHLSDSTDSLHVQIRKGLQDKKELDKEWLDLDRADHGKIIRLEAEIIHEIQLLGDRYKTDNSLLYQLGLRDGMALCAGQ